MDNGDNGDNGDHGDVGDETGVGEDYDTLLGEAERVLNEVDHALARLDDGTYGTCEVCGDAIGDDRLTGDPTARTCEQHLQLDLT